MQNGNIYRRLLLLAATEVLAGVALVVPAGANGTVVVVGASSNLVGVEPAAVLVVVDVRCSCLTRAANSMASSFCMSICNSFSRRTRFFKISFFSCSLWRLSRIFCVCVVVFVFFIVGHARANVWQKWCGGGVNEKKERKKSSKLAIGRLY